MNPLQGVSGGLGQYFQPELANINQFFQSLFHPTPPANVGYISKNKSMVGSENSGTAPQPVSERPETGLSQPEVTQAPQQMPQQPQINPLLALLLQYGLGQQQMPFMQGVNPMGGIPQTGFPSLPETLSRYNLGMGERR